MDRCSTAADPHPAPSERRFATAYGGYRSRDERLKRRRASSARTSRPQPSLRPRTPASRAPAPVTARRDTRRLAPPLAHRTGTATRTGLSIARLSARMRASRLSRSASPYSRSRPEHRWPSSLLAGSVALLADLIHNFGDALTAIPLGIAFFLRSFRGEKLAGLAVVPRSSSRPAWRSTRRSSASSTRSTSRTYGSSPSPG